ncbi:MAG: MFS transporter [Francisella endosymbiont of Hyalomma asiaticum]
MLLTYISIASASAVITNPALPDIAREFDFSSGAVEWLVSIFLLVYVLGQIIYGPIAKRYGYIVNLGLGLLIMSVLVTWSIYYGIRIIFWAFMYF